MTTKEFIDKVMNWEDRSPTMVLEATIMIGTEIIAALADVSDRIEIEGKMSQHVDPLWAPELKLYTDMKKFVTTAINAFNITFDTDQYPEDVECKELFRLIELIPIISQDINNLTEMMKNGHENLTSDHLGSVLYDIEEIFDKNGKVVDIFWIDELSELCETWADK